MSRSRKMPALLSPYMTVFPESCRLPVQLQGEGLGPSCESPRRLSITVSGSGFDTWSDLPYFRRERSG